MSKTFLFQAIQFNISTQFSSIRPIDRILLGATTPGQSGPGSDGNEGVFRIPQSSSITGTSPSDCLVSYPGFQLGVLSLCSDPVGVVYSPLPPTMADWALIKSEYFIIFMLLY